MKRTSILLSSAAILVLTIGVLTQAKPNFAGNWTVVPDPSAAAGGGGGRGGGFGGLGQGGTITQDDKTLKVTTTTQAGEVTRTYNLDGSDSKNTMNFGGNAMEQVSKVKWDGAKMVITTSSNFNGNPVETTQTWSLHASGNLVIESTGGRGGPTNMTFQKR